MERDITTGEQTVSAAGAITGTLDTSALSGDFTIKLRVRGLTSGKKIQIALEDTASATPFDDARALATWDLSGGGASGELNESKQSYELKSARFGAANNALRFNVLSIDASTTAKVYGSFEGK